VGERTWGKPGFPHEPPSSREHTAHHRLRSRPAKPASALESRLSGGGLVAGAPFQNCGRTRCPRSAFLLRLAGRLDARVAQPRGKPCFPREPSSSSECFSVRRMKTIELRSSRGLISERCFVADTPFARMRGLLGRRSLSSGEGLLLRPASSVHTFFMRFPIDVVFVDRAGEVVKIADRVRPWRTAGARGAKAVIELPAGEAERRRVREGDRVELSVSTGSASGPAASHPPSPRKMPAHFSRR